MSTPSLATATLSNRLCDGVCIAGALWTLACHFTVLTSGNMYALLVTAALFFAVGIVGWIYLGRREQASSTATASSEAHDAKMAVPQNIRVVASIAGLVVAGAFLFSGDIRQAWWLLVPWLVFATWQQCSAFDLPEQFITSKTSEAVLWLLALAAVTIALVAHRSNIDDSYYLALATGAADHPERAIYGFDPMYGTDAQAMRPPYYRVLSIELLAAAVSWLFSIPSIFFMHIIFASFAALLIPLASARLLRLLSPTLWLWCTVALMVFLVVDGNAPTSYGNMSLVRIQQGKSLMLMVVLPLTVAYSLELMRGGGLRSWVLLAASLIFALGCSPTAMVLFPAVSGLTLLAAWRPSWEATKRLLSGVATAIYPVAVALLLIRLASQLPVVESNWKESAGDATNYAYLMNYMYLQVFGGGLFGALVLWVIAAGWVFFESTIARRVALLLSLGCLLVFYNPWMAMVASGHPSLISTYWRVLWIIPFPSMLAMTLMAGLALLGPGARFAERMGVFIAAIVIFVVVFSGRSALSAANSTEVRPPGLKVDENYAVAERLAEIAGEPDQFIAPEGVAGWVTTMHHHPFPLANRIRYLRAYGGNVSRDEMLQRFYLQRYIAGEVRLENAEEFFRAGLASYPQLKAVCLSTEAEWLPEAEDILTEAGFEPVETPGPYKIWQKPDATEEANR